jgi:hypothetical protein
MGSDKRVRRTHSLILVAVVLLLAGCGGAPAGLTSAPTPIPPTPAHVSIPGIEEPLVVGDMSIRVLDAYTEDSLSWDTETDPVYPDDLSHTFFEVLVGGKTGGGARNQAFFDNIRLVHKGEVYEMIKWGIKFGEDGKIVGTILVFSVPKGSQFAEYVLKLTDEVSIGLAPFFK